MTSYDWFSGDAYELFYELIFELCNSVRGWRDMPDIFHKASILYKGMKKAGYDFPLLENTAEIETSKSGKFLIQSLENGDYEDDETVGIQLNFIRKHLAKFALNGLEISTLARAGALS